MSHKYSDNCTCDDCNKKFNETLFSNLTTYVQCACCKQTYEGKSKKDENITHDWKKIKHRKNCRLKDKPHDHDYCNQDKPGSFFYKQRYKWIKQMYEKYALKPQNHLKKYKEKSTTTEKRKTKNN